jgi:ActR/RegA family two-component response regulator
MARFVTSLPEAAMFVKPTSPGHIVETLQEGSDAFRTRHTTSLPSGADETIDSVVWEHTNDVLLRCCGNMTRAAELLGIPRQTLYGRLRKHPTPLRDCGIQAPRVNQPFRLRVRDPSF